MIKSRRMRWAVYVARGEKRILVGETEEQDVGWAIFKWIFRDIE
jgi:hypothetical protein